MQNLVKLTDQQKEFELRAIEGKLCKIINSHSMTKLLNKQQRGVIAQLCSLDVLTSKSSISLDIQRVIHKHSKIFEDIPKGILPPRDHDQAIHLIVESGPGPNIKAYRHPMAKRAKLSIWLKKC